MHVLLFKSTFVEIAEIVKSEHAFTRDDLGGALERSAQTHAGAVLSSWDV